MIKTETRNAVYGPPGTPNKTAGEQDHERHGIWKTPSKEMWGRRRAEQDEGNETAQKRRWKDIQVLER